MIPRNYSVTRDRVWVAYVADRPGVLNPGGEWLLPSGERAPLPTHPFLSLSIMDPSAGPTIFPLLDRSRSTQEFLAALRLHGYTVLEHPDPAAAPTP